MRGICGQRLPGQVKRCGDASQRDRAAGQRLKRTMFGNRLRRIRSKRKAIDQDGQLFPHAALLALLGPHSHRNFRAGGLWSAGSVGEPRMSQIDSHAIGFTTELAERAEFNERDS